MRAKTMKNKAGPGDRPEEASSRLQHPLNDTDTHACCFRYLVVAHALLPQFPDFLLLSFTHGSPSEFRTLSLASLNTRPIQKNCGRFVDDWKTQGLSGCVIVLKGRTVVAERVGFEPTVGLHPRQFSRLVHSTALPPLHYKITWSNICENRI